MKTILATLILILTLGAGCEAPHRAFHPNPCCCPGDEQEGEADPEAEEPTIGPAGFSIQAPPVEEGES